MTIEVGYTLTHDNRRRAIPQAHAGLLGYRRFLSGGDTMPTCQIVIPLSFTTAVQISAQRSDPPTSPARWTLCTLRDTALANEPGAQPITVDADRTAIQLNGQVCALTWAQERLTDRRFHGLTLRGMQGRCPTAEQARKLVTTLASAPPLPPAPARPGLRPDQPDEPVDPVCPIVAAIPTDCRPRQEITVPTGTDTIMRAGAGDQGPDLACALLAPAIEADTGHPPMTAHTNEKCVGAPPDRTLTFTLALTNHTPEDLYTNPPPPITAAGHPAINSGNNTSFRTLDIAPHHDLNRTGNIRLLDSFELPPGPLHSSSPHHPTTLATVDHIAEFLLRTYFR